MAREPFGSANSEAVRRLTRAIGIAFLVTIIFNADVDAQGGAYATGVLVLMTSAAVAATLSARRRQEKGRTIGFGLIAAVFLYTTGANVVERPDGVKIGAFFIAAIITVSMLSRLWRAFELRVDTIELDPIAGRFVRDCARTGIRLVANEPDARDDAEYREKIRQIMHDHDLPSAEDIIFVEVTVTDASDFEIDDLKVKGEVLHNRYRVLTVESSSVPNAIAALMLQIRDLTGVRPHIYFEWTEGNPALNFLRYLIFGKGEVAPVTGEVLRQAEPDRDRRPHLHVS